MAEKFIEIDGALKLLDSMRFDKRSQKNIIRRVTRKGGNVFKAEVRNQINKNNAPPSLSNNPNRGSGNKYEHIDRIRKAVKTVTSRSRRNPGVNVYIKGRDVPVGQGKTRRFWTLQYYAKLVFFGNYKQSPRKKRSNKKSTGNVRGIAEFNPFLRAYRLRKTQASRVVISSMIPEIQKEIAKQRRRI